MSMKAAEHAKKFFMCENHVMAKILMHEMPEESGKNGNKDKNSNKDKNNNKNNNNNNNNNENNDNADDTRVRRQAAEEGMEGADMDMDMNMEDTMDEFYAEYGYEVEKMKAKMAEDPEMVAMKAEMDSMIAEDKKELHDRMAPYAMHMKFKMCVGMPHMMEMMHAMKDMAEEMGMMAGHDDEYDHEKSEWSEMDKDKNNNNKAKNNDKEGKDE